MRIDDLDEADPFGELRGTLSKPFARPGGAVVSSELLVNEAIEPAQGRRHLTILHSDPGDVATSRLLSAFYEELRRLADGCEWVRVRGNAEYVTVTVGGAVADEQIALIEAAAAFAPGSPRNPRLIAWRAMGHPGASSSPRRRSERSEATRAVRASDRQCVGLRSVAPNSGLADRSCDLLPHVGW